MCERLLFSLGLGLTPPWKVVIHRLDTNHKPTKRYLEIGADRGVLYPCTECGATCKAHDFKEYTWRLSTFSSIIASARPDYRGLIARNTESGE